MMASDGQDLQLQILFSFKWEVRMMMIKLWDILKEAIEACLKIIILF
jgi:hypothetical protein